MKLKPRTTYINGQGHRIRIAAKVTKVKFPKLLGLEVFWSIGGFWYTEDGDLLCYNAETGEHDILNKFTSGRKIPMDLVQEDPADAAWWANVDVPMDPPETTATLAREVPNMGEHVQEQFKVIGDRMLKSAEGVQCDLPNFYLGLVEIRNSINERLECASAGGVDLVALTSGEMPDTEHAASGDLNPPEDDEEEVPDEDRIDYQARAEAGTEDLFTKTDGITRRIDGE